MRGALRVAYASLWWATFATVCALMFVGATLCFVVTAPFDERRVVQHLYSCFWAQIMFYINPFWRLRIDGRQKLPWRGAAVLVSNHESLGDILVLFGLYRPYKWVSKAAVFKSPFLGWNMRYNGYVPLVRGNKASIIEMNQRCHAWLKKGVPILLFPEGTRSPDTEVKAFKDGAFRLAVEAGCPVYPIALTGTADTLPKHGLVVSPPANCWVRVLDPVDPGQFAGDVEALRDHVRAQIIAEKERMLAAGGPNRAN
ncbi:1-acyl-sn-glycerol-3-phosphate acyltransferase [Pseudenhygromyxa sp. WMMC2535]|uniref:lysophospholipid acyltransferase family protein n=1 Tax=Pseudenhygromyxa sp. WMMC2535 TaxID=2712867 RepID=UPI0015562827|nr:lysophospholipid acyltransferase family protein [Pseudenhygromyxa sp. WMMC2535]NVB43050.1 1-acyl-sn-glycerol-3-phosphate acyltransferase [Pseudenhygromyxa sp. WMMC2535]